MDSRQVLARFEAERQALALMDHPNIAKVFDGGMTAEGRPFFVMEFVKGVPLTEYCDNARLTLKERLQLLVASSSVAMLVDSRLSVELTRQTFDLRFHQPVGKI